MPILSAVIAINAYEGAGQWLWLPDGLCVVLSYLPTLRLGNCTYLPM